VPHRDEFLKDLSVLFRAMFLVNEFLDFEAISRFDALFFLI
jgi:hypothetical protein